MARTAMRVAAVLVLGALLAIAVVVVRLRVADPFAALPRDPPGSASTLEERRERQQGRTLLHVALRGESVGDVRFVVSLPEPLPEGPIPLVFVLGGLEGGTRSIGRITEAIGDPGPNAFVAYDWPLPPKEPSAVEIAAHLVGLRRNALSIPGQVDAMVTWTSRQRWADPERVSLLGFSLGSFVAPAAQRVVEAHGARVGWTIIAYGGAPIGAVIAGHPGVRPRWAAPLLGAAMDLLLRPVQPAEHLPRLHGRFLLLRGGSDRLIPAAAAARLVDLAPQPRTVVVLEGDHMGLGPDKKKLLARAVAATRTWMIEQGALAPAGPRHTAAPAGGGAGDPGRSGRSAQ
jgi:hypothetical protein